MQNPMRRLPLDGAPNTRDLGGYPCRGGVTRWGVFYRSASTHAFTPQDMEMLRTAGIADAIDLRSEAECRHSPSALQGASGFIVHGVPLLDRVNSHQDTSELPGHIFEGDVPGSMSGLYISLLDRNAEDLVRVCALLAEAKGAALFNCTAGKDRTGVVAMLLLNLAGVANDDIVADYAVTEIYMGRVFLGLSADDGESSIPEFVLRSIPESMRRALRHLEDTWGDARQYLLAGGMPQSTIDTLLEKFVATV